MTAKELDYIQRTHPVLVVVFGILFTFGIVALVAIGFLAFKN